MANTIILKRSATPGKVPTTGQLALGEIAINTHDGLLYIKKDNGTPSVVQIGGVTSVNGETGTVTIDTGDVSENGNLYFTNARARSAVSAGTGISYSSSTGVISTAQNLTSAGSPSFAGLTLTGNATVTGDILPSADNVYSLGSATYMWKDVYVGPGSLYVNGQKVLEDNSGTITFSADPGQSLQIKTTNAGNIQLSTDAGSVIQVGSTLQITSGKNITDSAGVKVNFGDNIEMNSNKIIGLGTPSASTDAATKGYVDSSVAAISTSSISQGNSSVQVVDSGTGTVTVAVDGSTALTVTSSGVVVAGNFTVQGTTTTVESNTVSVADNIITLNSDVTGAPSQNAGIEVERGDEANVQVRWNEGTDKWTFTNDGATYQAIPALTTDLAEGSNLYYTDARARAAVSASSATGVSYNSSTGTFSLGGIPNSSLSNNSITINGSAVALGGTRTLDTDAVGEGSTNLYHTTARARGAVSATAGTGISYNSSTGAFSLASIPNSSLTNTTVTIGTTGIALGATSTTLAGLTSVTSTGFTGALTGNASTATTLQNARNIQGVSFDGSANITVVTAGAGITVTGTAVAIDSTVATLTGTQTLTNKTLTSPVVGGTTTLKTGSTSVADEYVVYLSASSTTADQVLDSIATASYTSVHYVISVETSTDKEVWQQTLTYNSSNAVYLGEQNLVSTSATALATFDADISSGNLRLLVTPAAANTKFKVKAIAYKV